MWHQLVAALSLASSAFAASWDDNTVFSNVSIFTIPAANYSDYISPKVLYARTVLLNKNCEKDDVLLATWENYSPEPPYFPIFQSDDLGKSWREISRVHDQVNGWGLRYQPFLYELPQRIGNFSAGTLLLSGSSIPADLSETQIELYASTDKGHTWEFISHIAHGGVALPNNGETPVWEPFLMVYNDALIVYYSDQRDPAYGQKMVHQTSKDLYTWTDPVNDVAEPTYNWRPGMPVVSPIGAFGQYIMTYEFYGATEASFAVYYKISTDPLNFGKVPGQVLKATDGTIPTGSPYVVWTSVGGPLGTIVVSSGSSTGLFLNHNMGAGQWTRVNTKERRSYTRSLTVLPNKNILIAGGGLLPPTNNTYVSASVVDLEPIPPPFESCEREYRPKFIKN